MMDCKIIRDLFPSYIDGLTSEESNHVIREHLEECAECREYLEVMKAELASGKYMEQNKAQAKTEIKVFKKLRRRIFYAVIITAVVVAFLCGVYEGYFAGGVGTLPGDVDVTYENVDGVVTLGLVPKKNNVCIEGGAWASVYGDDLELEGIIVPVNHHIRPLTIPQEQRGCYLTYVFKDDGTVIYENPYAGTVKIQGDETLEIMFGEKTVEIEVNDLRTEAGADKLRQWLKTYAEELEELED